MLIAMAKGLAAWRRPLSVALTVVRSLRIARRLRQIRRSTGIASCVSSLPTRVTIVGLVVASWGFVGALAPGRAASSHAAEAAAADTNVSVPPAPERPLEEMVDRIERRIAALRGQGDAADADDLAERLRAASRPLDPSFEPPASDELELHVVGLYEGTAYSLSHGKAEIRVTHRAAPLILCLTAYSPVAWHVEVGEGVRLRQVILGGYESQKVVGLPEDVPVADYSVRAAGIRLPYAYAKQDSDSGATPYRALAKQLRELTHLEISTFWRTPRGCPVSHTSAVWPSTSSGVA